MLSPVFPWSLFILSFHFSLFILSFSSPCICVKLHFLSLIFFFSFSSSLFHNHWLHTRNSTYNQLGNEQGSTESIPTAKVTHKRGEGHKTSFSPCPGKANGTHFMPISVPLLQHLPNDTTLVVARAPIIDN